LFIILWLFSCFTCQLFCSLDSSRAVRAVSIAGTKGCTTAAAEVLLRRGSLIAGAGRSAPGYGSAAVVNSAIIIELTAVTETIDDVSNTKDEPEDSKDDTPVADGAKDKQANDDVDNTTAKRRDHTGKSSENGGGLELNADEKKAEDHHVAREHTDGEVGSVAVEFHTTVTVIIDIVIEGVAVTGNKRENTMNEQKSRKNKSGD